MNSDKATHLGMIQGVVNRLAQNSFYHKGWSVILVSALFALAANDARLQFVLVAYFPAIVFWCLDGYFLGVERRFRDLYNEARQRPEDDIDFSMAIKPLGLLDWACATLSKTIWPFHVLIIASIIVVTIIALYAGDQ